MSEETKDKGKNKYKRDEDIDKISKDTRVMDYNAPSIENKDKDIEEDIMHDKETFFVKYLDQRFKNIEDKMDNLVEAVNESKKDNLEAIKEVKKDSLEAVKEAKKDNQNIVNMIQSEVHDQNESIRNIYNMLWALGIGIILAILTSLLTRIF
ncbi:MAG: hypothetical protein JW984_03170 [Deltaproteobacteria bacterium]|uniref:Uncharacterized protein n=1 Tax=Candidatus Zymogenus saltonus TaxID=2844893 RepID=A0A9D8PNQ4_9DELT|nr:hypothetical protein [Candidatus Zymogenus saltonus]